MNKNSVILLLAFVILILVGVVIATNYDWFSEEWVIGLGMILASFVSIGIYVYLKIKN